MYWLSYFSPHPPIKSRYRKRVFGLPALIMRTITIATRLCWNFCNCSIMEHLVEQHIIGKLTHSQEKKKTNDIIWCLMLIHGPSVFILHFEFSRTLFCEKYIIPRTTAAGKYISLYRKIRDHGHYIHPVVSNQLSHTSTAEPPTKLSAIQE